MELKRDYHADDPRLGRVSKVDGALVGISGYEKKYNSELTGQDFVYEVMVDRQQRVIEETFHEISKLKPGQDVYLTKEEWP